MRASKLLSSALLVAAAIALDARGSASAVQYCAQYNNGTQDCGIPSLASCEQSVRGVGGVCVPDRRSQQRRQRRPAFPLLSPYPDPSMPPPPFN